MLAAIALAHSLVHAEPMTPMSAGKVAGRPRVLVLDFKAVGVAEGEAGLLRDAVVSRLSRFEKLEVISTAEMKTLVDIEASKQASGCDPVAGNACLAEIAGALGAEYVVAGNAGKLGDVVVVNLALLRAAKAEAIARTSVQAPSLDDVLAKLGPAVDELAEPIAGAGTPLLLYAGGAVGAVGLVAVVGGALWAANLEAILEDTRHTATEKQQALDQRVPSLATLGAGVVLLAAGMVMVTVAEVE